MADRKEVKPTCDDHAFWERVRLFKERQKQEEQEEQHMSEQELKAKYTGRANALLKNPDWGPMLKKMVGK